MFERFKNKFLFFFKAIVFNNYRKFRTSRKIYWDQRAEDIKTKYNSFQGDFVLLQNLIDQFKVKKLLEIGCGSGRLLPVYVSSPSIEVINLQDISPKALSLIETEDKRVNTISVDIPRLKNILPKQDLIVSNRVLQHITENEIDRNIAAICSLSDIIYINELSNSDGIDPASYMIIHDYVRYFRNNGFAVNQTGLLVSQTYYVFKKIY